MQALFKSRHVPAGRLVTLGLLFGAAALFGLGCPGGSGDGLFGPAPVYHAFAYVTNLADSTVSAFTVDPATGALSANGIWKTGQNPGAVVTMNYGASGFVYVANESDSTVSQYSFSTSGALTPLNPPTVAAGGLPSDIAVGAFQGASSNVILVANSNDNTISYYTINTDGTLAIKSTFPSGGTGPSRIVTNSTSIFVMNGVNNMICPFTYSAGAFTKGTPFSLPGVSDIAFNSDADASDVFAVAAGNSNTLSRLQDHAPITSKQSLALPTSPLSVAIDPGIVTGATQNGIYIGSNAGFIDQYTQDPSTLKITPQNNAPVSVPSKDMVLRASEFPIPAIQHRLYAVFSDANLVRVYATDNVGLDTTNSTATPTGNFPSDIAFAVVTVTTGGLQTTVKSAHKAR